MFVYINESNSISGQCKQCHKDRKKNSDRSHCQICGYDRGSCRYRSCSIVERCYKVVIC
ncbi:hypothetical protein PBCV1_A201aL [Paramecium bursaria Chlorella virus 1]|uniref:Uncharacterized protein n=1 Tax=Paramecium bursaria Chlorella virus 1 TaxID=10506 RepID=F8TTZ5_PBCV1|nr:hypothetical protein PBCV1_A201aL [Paramecium bursaria Chlorella virus 1]AEI70056.1 hypothetical protein [Paramecium bursaria Chlorella virus 1]